MTVYVFAYGSLLNKEQLKKEFNKNKKVLPVIISGFTRYFNVSSSGGKYKVLGIKNKKGAQCNGILFTLSEEELEKLIKREKNYSIKTIENKRVSFHYGKTIVLNENDQVLCFYPKPNYILTKKEADKIPIRPYYLTTCLEGAKSMGEDFLHDFVQGLS